MSKVEKWLLLEAIFSFILAMILFYFFRVDHSFYLLFIPFDLIGAGLRWLSLSSFMGNIFSLILYASISLIPIVLLLGRKRKGNLKGVDGLLLVISFYSFYMLYHFINPRLMLFSISNIFTNEDILPMAKLSYVTIFYALVIGYLLLRMTAKLSEAKSDNSMSYLSLRLRRIVIFLASFYTFLFCYAYTFEMLTKIGSFTSTSSSNPLSEIMLINNPMASYDPVINIIIILVTYLLKGLPILYTILILSKAITLLKAMATNHLKEEEITAAARMGHISKTAVYITFFCNITYNVLLFLMSKQISDHNFSLEISLFPLIIAFTALILSGFFKETKVLLEENEMII